MAGLLQQFVQRFQQHALLASVGLAGGAVIAAQVLLHMPAALGPAGGEALRPGRCGLLVIAEPRIDAHAVAMLDQVIQHPGHARIRCRRLWALRSPICDITPAAASCSSSFS